MIDLRSHRTSPYQQSLVLRPRPSGTNLSPALPKKSPRQRHSASCSAQSPRQRRWGSFSSPVTSSAAHTARENLLEFPLQRHDTTQAMDAEIEDKEEQDEETGDGTEAKDGDDQDLNMDVEEEFEDEDLDQSMEPAILRLCPEVLALIFHYVYVTPVVRRPTTAEKAAEPRPEGVDPGQESSHSTPSALSPSSSSPDLSEGDSAMETLTPATTTINLVTATSESDPQPTTTDNSTAGVQKRKVKSTVYIQNDLSSMLALCLTCQAFYPQAVRLLWRQRTLANDDDLAEFYQAIDFSQSLRKRHQKQRQQREQQRQRLGMGYAMEEGVFNNEAALRIKSLTLLDMSLTSSPISSSCGATTSSSSSAALPLAATSAVVGSSSSGSSSLGSDPVQALSSQFFGSSSSSHGDSNYRLAGSAGLNLCRGIDSLTGGSAMTVDESLAQIHQSYGSDKEQAQAWIAASPSTSTASSPMGSPILSKRRLRQKTSSIYSDMVSPRLLHAIANHFYALVDLTICMDKKPTTLTFAPAFQPTIAFSILAGSLLSLKRLTLMGLVCDPSQNKTGSELLLFAQQAQPLERISIRTCQGISLETYVEWATRSKGSLLSVDFQGLDFESSQDLTDMMGAFAFHCRSLSSITLSCMNALSLDGMMEAFAYYRAFQIQELHVLGHDTFRTTQQAAAAAAHPAVPGVVDGAGGAAAGGAAGLAALHVPQANPEGLATVPVTQLCHVSDANVAMAQLAQLSLRRLTLYCPGITDFALVQYVSRSPQLVDLVLNEPTTLLQLPQYHHFVQLNTPPASAAPTAAEITHNPSATTGVPLLTPSPLSLQPFTSAAFFTILLKKSPWLKYIFMKLTLDTAQEWIAQPCFKELGLDKCLYQYRTATGAPAVVLMRDTRSIRAATTITSA